MNKLISAMKKTIKHYQYYGLKKTYNAVWYQVKIRLFKGKIYVDMTEKYKNFNFHLSLSHCREYACAVVIKENKF